MDIKQLKLESSALGRNKAFPPRIMDTLRKTESFKKGRNKTRGKRSIGAVRKAKPSQKSDLIAS